MFNFSDMRIINKTFVTGILAINSLAANAALTSYSSNGVDLVYSSVSNVTWTKDGNLLGSMIANSSDANANGAKDVIEAILEASAGKSYGSTTGYYLNASSFESNGQTTWWGAHAFINYLNSINYAGNNQWRLPTVTAPVNDDCTTGYNGSTYCGYNVATNGSAVGNEYAELFNEESIGRPLLDKDGNYQFYAGIKDPGSLFDNEQSDAYSTGTEFASDPNYAYHFGTSAGNQYITAKGYRFFTWAITTGHITTVPEPESTAMLFVGLGLIAFIARRRI